MIKLLNCASTVELSQLLNCIYCCYIHVLIAHLLFRVTMSALGVRRYNSFLCSVVIFVVIT